MHVCKEAYAEKKDVFSYVKTDREEDSQITAGNFDAYI